MPRLFFRRLRLPFSSSHPRHLDRRRRRRCRLNGVEALEDRTLLSTLNLLSPAGVVEGETLTFALELRDTNGNPEPASQSFAVELKTTDGIATAGQDYQEFNGFLTFPAGATTINVNIATFDDPDLIEGFETFLLEIVSVTGTGVTVGNGSAVGTIQDNEPFATAQIVGPAMVAVCQVIPD